MNKLFAALLIILFPALGAAADSALTFTPPPGDVSVLFLGNIFGAVDGVLHGSGSQIMGTLFGVFNAAVLALGGIIIMYTLLVSTLNTAQEGQFLGQKWSSLWVPVRTTMGLALLIPKASGYCLMQIFVMWIILQGVGAADKVWSAALSYLNRGGAIILAQENPAQALMEATSPGIFGGAQDILAGQVCMIGIRSQLENQRKEYLKQKQDKTGPCYNPSDEMKDFCGRAVPNFLNTVNVISAQGGGNTSVPMPNFASAPYNQLNGICGTVAWNKFSFKDNDRKALGRIMNNSEIDTAEMSRSIALQQMYISLGVIAQKMVANNPGLSPDNNAGNGNKNFSEAARLQFGIPLNKNGDTCTNPDGQGGCPLWGFTSGEKKGPLFNGTEFSGAISAYNGIMRATLTIQHQAANAYHLQKGRAFIKEADNKGWMMAGSYFFNLVALNQQAADTAKSNLSDTDSGIEKSSFSSDNLIDAFATAARACNESSQYKLLCAWLNKDVGLVKDVIQLVEGGNGIEPVSKEDLAPGKKASRRVVTKDASATVFGFTNNATLLTLPGQPGGSKSLRFAEKLNMKSNLTAQKLPLTKFPCGGVDIPFVGEICIGKIIGSVVYDGIVVPINNLIGSLLVGLVQKLFFEIILLPITALSSIFGQAVKILSLPGINPIVALANMGTYYINFAGDLLLYAISSAIAAVVFSGGLLPLALLVIVFTLLSMPILLAWMGVMVMLGMVTAYYIPLVPYMIFTLASIGWLIAVIEAMVAAPLVALGVTHPEGHESFGKGEQALMILMNVFLRPSLMIIGYITAISLSYVGVWVLNAGFDTAVSFIHPPTDETFGGTWSDWGADWGKGGPLREGLEAQHQFGGEAGKMAAQEVAFKPLKSAGQHFSDSFSTTPIEVEIGAVEGGYTGWSALFGFFMSIIFYVTLYLIIVQRAFSLIVYLPDKVLRWIGGQPESIGQETMQWGDEAKQKIQETSKEAGAAQAAVGKTLKGWGDKAVEGGKAAVDIGAKAAGGAAAL